MGLIEFAKHIYAYFKSDDTNDPNDSNSKARIVGANTTIPVLALESYVPVYNTSGNLIRYIEIPIKNESAKLPALPEGPSESQHAQSPTLYRRLSSGEYVPLGQTTALLVPLQSTVPPVVTTVPKPPKPTLTTPLADIRAPKRANDLVWDGWPDGDLVYDVDFEQYKDTGKLQVHWAITTSGGDKKGSKHSDCWETGKRSSRRCLGVMECDDPTCQIITRPHVKPARIAAQLQKPCHCGGTLTRKDCNVVSYIWTWSGGIHYENRGQHLHRRPTHLLHLLPHEKEQFTELVTSHPKSGPLQLVIGVPGLRGPGKSVAEISDVLLNTHRVGKECSKIIKGETIGTIDKLISTFAKFDKENPNVVVHSTFGAETVISLQTPFMRSQLVKDNPLKEPVNRIVSDATHNWWIAENSLLIISSTYCPVLMCWVPGILTYSNGATSNHFLHHFYALIRSIALEAESRNIPVTKELFAGMMDFSEAERTGFIEGYFTYFLQRPENTFTRQELRVIAERLLKGCREHFRASIERIAKMLHIIPRESKDDFTRRANDLIYLPSTEQFIEQAKLLVKDFPNIANWMEWWIRPAHARMLFESNRDMNSDLWKSLPDTNNPQEAMNSKLYQGCGRDHHFLKGMYALLKVARHYEVQFQAASTGVPIRYGQPEPWKAIAEKQGHTKPSRSQNPADIKRKKNDGRPPDTAKELLKTNKKSRPALQDKPVKPKKQILALVPPPPKLGPPSYKWNANSCWLDTSLELIFVCVFRRFDEFQSRFHEASEGTVLHSFYNMFKIRDDRKEDVPDEVISQTLTQSWNTFRAELCQFGTIDDTSLSYSLMGWLYNVLNRSFPMTAYPSIQYFNTWYIDFHTCSGAVDWGYHVEIGQPRRSPELQLLDSHHAKYKGNFKDYFRDRFRIDRQATPATMCWRTKDSVALCSGMCEDVKDLILSIPIVLTVEIGIETPEKPCSWDFPETLYPHTQPSAKTHGLAYDLVGLALLNPSIHHFIGRYASSDRQTIYTYDGMSYGGFTKEEPNAKFCGYISGPKINLPKGYLVYQAFYHLRGGLGAQEQFFKIRTAALT